MRKQLIDDLNAAILNGELPPQCEEAVDWLERHTNLQAAKPADHIEDKLEMVPAEGSLPVVATLIISKITGEKRVTLVIDPPLQSSQGYPLTDHAQATAEIAKRDAEIARLTKSLVIAGFTNCGGELWKPPIGPSASPLLAELTTLRAELAHTLQASREMEDALRQRISELRAQMEELSDALIQAWAYVDNIPQEEGEYIGMLVATYQSTQGDKN